MKKSLLISIPAGIVIVSSTAYFSAQNSSNNLHKSPVLFAEGIINTLPDEYNPPFTPGSKTIYFTRLLDRKGNETFFIFKARKLKMDYFGHKLIFGIQKRK